MSTQLYPITKSSNVNTTIATSDKLYEIVNKTGKVSQNEINNCIVNSMETSQHSSATYATKQELSEAYDSINNIFNRPSINIKDSESIRNAQSMVSEEKPLHFVICNPNDLLDITSGNTIYIEPGSTTNLLYFGNNSLNILRDTGEAYYNVLGKWYSQNIKSVVKFPEYKMTTTKVGATATIYKTKYDALTFFNKYINFDSINVSNSEFLLYKTTRGYGSKSDGEFIKFLITNGEIYSSVSDPNYGNDTYPLVDNGYVYVYTTIIENNTDNFYSGEFWPGNCTKPGIYSIMTSGRPAGSDDNEYYILYVNKDGTQSCRSLKDPRKIFARSNTNEVWDDISFKCNPLPTLNVASIGNPDDMLDTGIYAYEWISRFDIIPDGRYDVFVERSSTPDGSGYYAIKQVFSSRETGDGYLRIIFRKANPYDGPSNNPIIKLNTDISDVLTDISNIKNDLSELLLSIDSDSNSITEILDFISNLSDDVDSNKYNIQHNSLLISNNKTSIENLLNIVATNVEAFDNLIIDLDKKIDTVIEKPISKYDEILTAGRLIVDAPELMGDRTYYDIARVNNMSIDNIRGDVYGNNQFAHIFSSTYYSPYNPSRAKSEIKNGICTHTVLSKGTYSYESMFRDISSGYRFIGKIIMATALIKSETKWNVDANNNGNTIVYRNTTGLNEWEPSYRILISQRDLAYFSSASTTFNTGEVMLIKNPSLICLSDLFKTDQEFLNKIINKQVNGSNIFNKLGIFVYDRHVTAISHLEQETLLLGAEVLSNLGYQKPNLTFGSCGRINILDCDTAEIKLTVDMISAKKKAWRKVLDALNANGVDTSLPIHLNPFETSINDSIGIKWDSKGVTVNAWIVDMSKLEMVYRIDSSLGNWFDITLSSMKDTIVGGTNSPLITSTFEYDGMLYFSSSKVDYKIYRSGSGGYLQHIYIRYDSAKNVNDFKTLMNGQYLLYELAEPIRIDFDEEIDISFLNIGFHDIITLDDIDGKPMYDVKVEDNNGIIRTYISPSIDWIKEHNQLPVSLNSIIGYSNKIDDILSQKIINLYDKIKDEIQSIKNSIYGNSSLKVITSGHTVIDCEEAIDLSIGCKLPTKEYLSFCLNCREIDGIAIINNYEGEYRVSELEFDHSLIDDFGDWMIDGLKNLPYTQYSESDTIITLLHVLPPNKDFSYFSISMGDLGGDDYSMIIGVIITINGIRYSINGTKVTKL